MSDVVPDDDRPKRRMFRSSSAPRLNADQAKRQGDITTLAFTRLGGREPALAFLNDHHSALDGRPLDLAMASAEGFTRVAELIGSHSKSTKDITT